MNKGDFAFGVFVGALAMGVLLIVMGSVMDTNFEKCSSRYNTAEEVTECIWLLENQ